MLTRRTLLLGGGATLLGAGAAGFAVERSRRDDAGPTTPAAPVPDVAPGPVVHGRFTSQARLGEPARWVLIRPPDVDGPLPLVVALHGHGGTAGQLLGPEWGLPQFLARPSRRASRRSRSRPSTAARASGTNGAPARTPARW